MFQLLALAFFQLTTLLGSPKASQTTTTATATETNFATTPTATPPPPSSNIGNTGWDND